MHRFARTAPPIRPAGSGSSTMQPATGQAAWQIEHAKAPKQLSGSITAIVLGAFLRGPPIILVHMRGLYQCNVLGGGCSLSGGGGRMAVGRFLLSPQRATMSPRRSGRRRSWRRNADFL